MFMTPNNLFRFRLDFTQLSSHDDSDVHHLYSINALMYNTVAFTYYFTAKPSLVVGLMSLQPLKLHKDALARRTGLPPVAFMKSLHEPTSGPSINI